MIARQDGIALLLPKRREQKPGKGLDKSWTAEEKGWLFARA
jgi:hypothetical protein